MAGSHVNYSAIESQTFGLKIGRYNASLIDHRVLQQNVIEGAYDLCRVRTTAKDEFAPAKLEKIGMPYYFSGGVRRYTVNVNKYPIAPFHHPDLVFELYDGSQRERVAYQLYHTWGEYPLCYYRTPMINHFIDKELESQALIDFYCKYNDNSTFPQSYLWLLNDKGKDVGFIALYVYPEDDMVDSTIAGILPTYQQDGYFVDILRHIRQFCRSIGLTYFCCGARNENIRSQMAFEKEYMKGYQVDYVYHVVSLLGNISKTREKKEQLTIDKPEAQFIDQQLYECCNKFAEKVLGDGVQSYSSFKSLRLEPIETNELTIELAEKVPSRCIVAKCFANSKIKRVGYYNIS